jgi:hypothetical protein
MLPRRPAGWRTNLETGLAAGRAPGATPRLSAGPMTADRALIQTEASQHSARKSREICRQPR